MGFNNNRRTPTKKNYRAKVHVYDGFPHFTTAFPHHCICLQECCMDMRAAADGKGCVCKNCPCQSGIPHGTKVYEDDRNPS